MSPGKEIVLRDVHDVPVPPLWPLTAAWWGVIVCVLLVVIALCLWQWRIRQKRLHAERLFDESVAKATSPEQKLQIMSELLRRSARKIRADADTLTGNAWLELLEAGMPSGSFTTEPGNLIASGLFMADVSAETVEKIEARVRTRFVSWMTGR